MRLIDADELERSFKEAIVLMALSKKALGLNGDVEAETIIKTYEDILGAIKTRPTVEPDSGKWIPCKPTQDYIINDKKLWDKERIILITYRTITGRKYARPVLSEKGHISKKINGDIIAWMELPAPYRGEE